MLLSRLQELIGGIYDVRVAYDVYDFLVTDRGRLPRAPHSGVADEELIVAQSADGSEVSLSLYLDPALLERLSCADPLVELHGGRGSEPLPLPRLERRARQAGVAARARDAGGGRQVRRELLADAPAVPRTLPRRAAPRA